MCLRLNSRGWYIRSVQHIGDVASSYQEGCRGNSENCKTVIQNQAQPSQWLREAQTNGKSMNNWSNRNSYVQLVGVSDGIGTLENLGRNYQSSTYAYTVTQQ